jgi:UDP-2,3-diacylglucosamine pyrophosphatase LpxH
MTKRHVDVVVISDVHLGTSASRAAELNAYLKTIQPGMLILNGDIVDLWDFRKGYWPEAHTKVIRRILKLAVDGVPVHYITGNHDGALRRYTALCLGAVNLIDRLELDLGGRRHWFLHGDAFDLALGTGRMLSWVGAKSYDSLVTLGTAVNAVRRICGLDRVSIANAFKNNLPAARGHINRYVDCCLHAAAARGYDAVVTGHIHVPNMVSRTINGREVTYLNSGDWIDSLSALEYANGQWSIVRWNDLIAQGLVSSPHLEDTVGILPVPAFA